MREESKKLIKIIEDNFKSTVGDGPKKKIISNAIDVFSKKGIHGTKIKDIAKKAQFSQGFIYNHFKSKDEIFTEIVRLASLGGEFSITSVNQFDLSAYDKLFVLAEVLLYKKSLAMDHFRLILLQATASESIPIEAKIIITKTSKNPVVALVPIIIKGQEDGAIVKEDAIMLAITYFSIIQGIIITRLQAGTDVKEPSIDMVLRFLRSEGE